jgi:WD40 repeat protein
VVVWDAVSGRQLLRGQGHLAKINCLAFAPDGSYLVSGSEDGTVRVWDQAGQSRVFAGHKGTVRRVAVRAGGKLVASADNTGAVLAWEPATLRETYRAPAQPSHVLCLGFLAGGNELLSVGTDGKIVRHQLDSGQKKIEQAPSVLYLAALNASGTMLAAAGCDDGTWVIRQQNLADSKWLAAIPCVPEARQLAFALGDQYLALEAGGKIHFAERAAGTETSVLHANVPGALTCFASSSDGMRVAAGSAGVVGGVAVKLWDVKFGIQQTAFRDVFMAVEPMGATELLFSSAGEHLIMSRAASLGFAGGKKGRVHVWKFPDLSWKDCRTLEHINAVFCVALSPDGTRLLTGHDGGVCRL